MGRRYFFFFFRTFNDAKIPYNDVGRQKSPKLIGLPVIFFWTNALSSVGTVFVSDGFNLPLETVKCNLLYYKFSSSLSYKSYPFLFLFFILSYKVKSVVNINDPRKDSLYEVCFFHVTNENCKSNTILSLSTSDTNQVGKLLLPTVWELMF